MASEFSNVSHVNTQPSLANVDEFPFLLREQEKENQFLIVYFVANADNTCYVVQRQTTTIGPIESPIGTQTIGPIESRTIEPIESRAIGTRTIGPRTIGPIESRTIESRTNGPRTNAPIESPIGTRTIGPIESRTIESRTNAPIESPIGTQTIELPIGTRTIESPIGTRISRLSIDPAVDLGYFCTYEEKNSNCKLNGN